MAKAIGGQPGNTNAVKNRPWRQALDRAIKRDTRGLLDKAAEEVLLAASTGDMAAIKELGDRLDGRPRQAVEVTDTAGIAERLQAAQDRLARVRGTTLTDDEEDPPWLQ